MSYFDEILGLWMDYLGLDPNGPVSIVDSAIATVAVEVDKVYRVDGPDPYLIHIELQANGDRKLPRRCLRYNVLLDLRHDLRVRTVVVLLRPEADTDNLTGTLELHLPDGRPVVGFHYEVVRVWQRPVAPLLAGSLETLPLAPLADVPREQVPEVIKQIDRRLAQEAPPAKAGKIMNTTLMLAGLRLEKDEIEELRGRLQTMNIVSESSYYHLLVEEGMKKGKIEGKIEEAQRLDPAPGREALRPAGGRAFGRRSRRSRTWTGSNS